MKSFKYLAVAAIMFMASVAVATAAKNKANKSMYVFGVVTSFNDSTAYITSIQMIDSVATVGKTGILANKQEYSYQLKDYMTRLGNSHSTCVTINAATKKQIEKLNAKMRERFIKKDKFIIKDIPESDFKYERVIMAQ